jgi:hypothetical protein
MDYPLLFALALPVRDKAIRIYSAGRSGTSRAARSAWQSVMAVGDMLRVPAFAGKIHGSLAKPRCPWRLRGRYWVAMGRNARPWGDGAEPE